MTARLDVLSIACFTADSLRNVYQSDSAVTAQYDAVVNGYVSALQASDRACGPAAGRGDTPTCQECSGPSGLVLCIRHSLS